MRVNRGGQKQRVNSTRRAFTRIELLVVIAVIAILAAILFPVFAQAREKARAIACLSNQKQVSLGILQYVQDYDETARRVMARRDLAARGGSAAQAVIQIRAGHGRKSALRNGMRIARRRVQEVWRAAGSLASRE